MLRVEHRAVMKGKKWPPLSSMESRINQIIGKWLLEKLKLRFQVERGKDRRVIISTLLLRQVKL